MIGCTAVQASGQDVAADGWGQAANSASCTLPICSQLQVCAVQVMLLIRQMEATATQTAVAKVPLLTVGQQAIMHAASPAKIWFCAVQVVLLIRQMEATATQAAVAKVPLLTVGQQAIMHAASPA